MDTSKFQHVFDPMSVRAPIHIIGCGSVGSTLAELLARYGLTQFHLWDFDKVERKNIANQMFFEPQVDKPKVDALADTLVSINEDCKNRITKHPNGWQGEDLNGIVFLCVDNIDLRREIVKANQYGIGVDVMFDVRTGLYDAQIYAARWSDVSEIKNLLRTMNFTHEEAKEETPTSACGTTLGVAATVRLAVTVCVMNFMKYLKTGEVKKSITVTTDLDIPGTVLAP